MNQNIERIVDNEADAQTLLAYYKEFLDRCADRLQDFMEVDEHGHPRNEADWTKQLPDLSYLSKNGNSPQNDYSDEKVDAYYYCKYGIAYAFEYAKIYELLLRIFDGNFLGVNSFGCGGFVDAWALAYARARTNGTDQPYLEYRGFDVTRWPLRVFQEAPDLIEAKQQSVIERFNITVQNAKHRVSLKTRKPEVQMGIQAFDEQALRQNVFLFPKLLNELDLTSETWSQFKRLLEGFVNKKEFLRNVRRRCYYICVSHSYWDVYVEQESEKKIRAESKGLRAVRDIVDVFTGVGYRASDALADVAVQEDRLVRVEAAKGGDEPWNVLYQYEEKDREEGNAPTYWKIKELDEDFKNAFFLPLPGEQRITKLLYGLSNSLVRRAVKETLADLPTDLRGRLPQLNQYQILDELEDNDLGSKEDRLKIKTAGRCQQMQSVGTIVFQIIKLTRTDA